MSGAPRLPVRPWRARARGALLVSCLWLVFPGIPVAAGTITAARYADPTDRYPHGVLGDAIEWGALELTLTDGRKARFELPQDHVFEDVSPRLADVDGDGDMEVIVVEADMRAGAALAIYDESGKITETPHIGTRFRWLAPVGVTDIDGDGAMEIAYVDRPHLAKTLRIWRYADAALTEAAVLSGVTNHRIGEPDIAGGIRTCGNGAEMVLATANWSELIAVRWDGTQFTRKGLGSDTSRSAFNRAMQCP